VTDDEAQLLASAFGSDDCYGLSWALLQLIETAPGARQARCPRGAGGGWLRLLAARADTAKAAGPTTPS
jgi:hypothetical protein